MPKTDIHDLTELWFITIGFYRLNFAWIETIMHFCGVQVLSAARSCACRKRQGHVVSMLDVWMHFWNRMNPKDVERLYLSLDLVLT